MMEHFHRITITTVTENHFIADSIIRESWVSMSKVRRPQLLKCLQEKDDVWILLGNRHYMEWVILLIQNLHGSEGEYRSMNLLFRNFHLSLNESSRTIEHQNQHWKNDIRHHQSTGWIFTQFSHFWSLFIVFVLRVGTNWVMQITECAKKEVQKPIGISIHCI